MSIAIDELRTVAIDAARIGGRILQDWRSRFTAQQKSPKDMVHEAVTESDIAAVVKRRRMLSTGSTSSMEIGPEAAGTNSKRSLIATGFVSSETFT